MNDNILKIINSIYHDLSYKIANVNYEAEGTNYDACKFELNGRKIISRSSKITPKKSGQFVTFWKRDKNGKTTPYSDADQFDFLVINSNSNNHLGQFVFPKRVLISQEIISTNKQGGKRGFRVYPEWDKPQSKQADKTQRWQLQYFYKLGEMNALKKAAELYKFK